MKKEEVITEFEMDIIDEDGVQFLVMVESKKPGKDKDDK